METKQLLPKRVVRYIHDMGVRALDHLADNFQASDGAPNSVQTLANDWKSMNTTEKEQFVERVAVSVVEVVAASAALPLGLKLGKKAAKAAKKAIRKQTKKMRKSAKAARKTKRVAKKVARKGAKATRVS